MHIRLIISKEVNSVKKILKKKIKSSSNAVRYFTAELKKFVKTEFFEDGTTGKCTWSC